MTPKQRIFADEYIKTRNATRAYMTAYPNVKNENTAHAAASRLLRNVTVSEYIDEQLDSLHNHSIADAAEIMEYLTRMIRGEETDEMMTMEGLIRDVKVRAADRNAAAKQLARMLGVESHIDSEKLKIEQAKAEREAKTAESKSSTGMMDAILKAVSAIE